VACRLNKTIFGQLGERTSGAALQPFALGSDLPHDTAITESAAGSRSGDGLQRGRVDGDKSWDLCIRAELEKAE
jgi:hypothetical protein